MVRSAPLRSALVTLIAAGGAHGCSDDQVDTLWCGEELCEWVAHGEVEKTATWHDDDLGIALRGDAGISRWNRWKASDGRCIAFGLVANFEEDATLYMEVEPILAAPDIHGWQVRLPLARWRRVSYRFPMMGEYSGLYFRVRNPGPARAVVSHLDMAIAPDAECPEPQPVRYPPLPE